MKIMFKIIQEATLPKLSQTSLYNKFNDSSNITSNLINEIKTAGSTAVKLDELSEILSLIKLNGDPVVKKAVNHLTDGDIVIIYNKSTYFDNINATTLPTTTPAYRINAVKHEQHLQHFSSPFCLQQQHGQQQQQQ